MQLRSFALSLALLLVSAARAESPEHALANQHANHRLWLRVLGTRTAFGGVKSTVVAPRFGGAFLLGEHLDLDVEVPLLVAKLRGEQDTYVLAGNPFVGLAYVSALKDTRFSIGGGATVPLAQGDGQKAHALRVARAARAGREAWLYTPDRMALAARGALETKVPHGPWLGFDVALAFLPRVRGSAAAMTSTTQLGISVAAALGESVRLGARLDGVLLPSDEVERLQSALVPFLHVSAEDGALFALEGTMNLDAPYGLSFRDGRVWGASLLAGSRF